MSRAARVLGGVGVGYLGQALTVIVGLWLTPFLLRHLGRSDYGLWLVALQATAYLGLLDLGVVALLPRETSFAVGRAGGTQHVPELGDLLGRTLRLVAWQLPLVVGAAFGAWLLMPSEWLALRDAIAMILGVFVLMFPLRVLHAALVGLQDLRYVGLVQLGTWAAGTVATVTLVLLGVGLPAVAGGWALSQLASAVLWWWRLRTRYPFALPRRIPRLSWPAVKPQLVAGSWVSVSQIAQLLLNGTDVLIIAKLLGPAAAVPYVLTGKLASVLANQPQMIMQAAQPALAELRASADRDRAAHVATALGQAMLLLSGLVFITVLLVNRAFVAFWVGSHEYGGQLLTTLVLAAMLLRHWNTTAVYTIFCFGRERRIAVTTLLDGVVTLVASLVLVPRLGVIGVAIGSIVGVCVVSLPANVGALLRDTGSTVGPYARALGAWAGRFVLMAGAASIIAHVLGPSAGPPIAAVAATTFVLLYVVGMAPIAFGRELGPYVRPRIVAVRARFTRFLRLRDA